MRFSALAQDEEHSALAACRELTHAVFDGLDLTREIRAVADQGLGDTVLLWSDSRLVGFAICHCGPGSEAGSGTCYMKFGAISPECATERGFERLLNAAEQLAYARGMSRLVAGVNSARHEAYRTMLARGFRTDLQGIAMHRPNIEGYGKAGVFVLDDWR